MDFTFDPNKIVQTIISKKSVFLAIVVALVFAFIGSFLYGDFSSKIATYKNDNQTKTNKINRISEYRKSQEELNKFLASVPKSLSSDELVSQVEDYAISNKVTIVNISSRDMVKQEYSKSMQIDLTVRTPSFKDLVGFFHTLEKSIYNYKIQTLSIKNGDTPGSMECDIIIQATELNT